MNWLVMTQRSSRRVPRQQRRTRWFSGYAEFEQFLSKRSLKRLHPNVPEDHSSHPKKKRATTSKDISSSEEDDDSDKDLEELYGDDSKQHNAWHKQTDDNDPLLSEIAEELQSSEETGPAIDKKKLAEMINKQWSAKLPESNLKDKYGKYLRRKICWLSQAWAHYYTYGV